MDLQLYFRLIDTRQTNKGERGEHVPEKYFLQDAKSSHSACVIPYQVIIATMSKRPPTAKITAATS